MPHRPQKGHGRKPCPFWLLRFHCCYQFRSTPGCTLSGTWIFTPGWLVRQLDVDQRVALHAGGAHIEPDHVATGDGFTELVEIGPSEGGVIVPMLND